MSDDPRKQAEDLFHIAIDLPAEQRAEFLDKQCGSDGALRAEVERLLRAGVPTAAPSAKPDEKPNNQAGVARSSVERPPLTEVPGATIGRYKLLQLIGEGAFGTVYMAEQEKPVRRRVALKIITPGMDTKQVIARFEAERQALAMMDHPNIAKVLDAGATETGRPYFVMELVKGISITDYCDQNNLNTKDRIKLFQVVCNAVQHAHQKGIIHRDLKPSNVMVTLQDGKPVPKVIDFGIAKAIAHRLTDKTLFTEFGQLVGTPEYMSPEQAEMSGLDIDTRADIYSLGVLLYELLTGTTPIEPQELRRAAYDEIQRIIREVEPPKPSTRLSTMGEKLTDVAKHRSSEPGGLGKQVRGDLDWIVMKALEKDRSRRYETANFLAQDIQRHLDHEPVQASPPSAVYRTRKFIRKHRAPIVTATVLAAAIVIGAIVSTVMYVRAESLRAAAKRAEAQAVDAKNQAVQDRKRAELAHQKSQATRAEAVKARKDALDAAGRAMYQASRAKKAEAQAEEEAINARSNLRKANHQLGLAYLERAKTLDEQGRFTSALLTGAVATGFEGLDSRLGKRYPRLLKPATPTPVQDGRLLRPWRRSGRCGEVPRISIMLAASPL